MVNIPFTVISAVAVLVLVPAQVKLLKVKLGIFCAAPVKLILLLVVINAPEVKVAVLFKLPAMAIVPVGDSVTLLVVLAPLIVSTL